MTIVKICGLSDVESALAAAEAGADFLGMIFAPSKRQVSPDTARKIAENVRSLSKRPLTAGIFVNAPAAEVNKIADYCHLDYVQLSGDETPDYCQAINKPVIKAFRIGSGQTSQDIIAKIEAAINLIGKERLICLLDAHSAEAYGGTGKTFDWKLAEAVSARLPVMVAGGLNPENVRNLILQAKPWGVDVSSGVETNGSKDVSKIKQFIKTAKTG